MEDIIAFGEEVANRNYLSKDGVREDWIVAYGMVSEKVDRNWGLGLSPYPYEAGTAMNP